MVQIGFLADHVFAPKDEAVARNDLLAGRGIGEPFAEDVATIAAILPDTEVNRSGCSLSTSTPDTNPSSHVTLSPRRPSNQGTMA